MSLSIEALSKPVSEDSPSGEDLEYDPQFMELVQLFEAKPKAGASVGSGDDDSGPDWRAIERLAAQLSERTRDLRVQVYATIASIYTQGMPGVRDNLKVLKIYLSDFWDSVHPQLDPDDDNDPMFRANTLQNLNEYSLISLGLEQVKLVELQGIGSFSPYSVALAEGKETPEEGEEVPDPNLIRQAFASNDPEVQAALQTAVAESLTLLDEINGVWIEKSGDSAGLVLSNANKAFGRVAAVVNEYSPGDAAIAVPADGEGGEAAADGGAAAAAAPVQGISGTVNSRADVIKALDRVCEYYAAQEPSSPVPLLLRRAQRLVEKSFMEILEDMIPDGVKTAKLVGGEDS